MTFLCTPEAAHAAGPTPRGRLRRIQQLLRPLRQLVAYGTIGAAAVLVSACGSNGSQPPDDAAALGANLARLMDDETLRAQMAVRALEVRERFSEAKHMRNWDALFRELGLGSAGVR